MPAPATLRTDGQLIEVFSSIQGEGLLIGRRQVFVRMAYCNLSCGYCDTPFEPQSDCRVEDSPGSGNFRSIPNPVALETLYNILYGWHRALPGVHHSLSLTGGEPLVQADLLAEWLPLLREILPIHLETNGTLATAVGPLLPHLDWVAMDIKLASATGCETPWREHREFLDAVKSVPGCVKVVVAEETECEELELAAALVHGVAPALPLILQPATRDGRISVLASRLLELQTRAARIHPHVQVIPQTHRFLGVA